MYATRPRLLRVEFPEEEIGVEAHERFLPFAASGLYRTKIKHSRVLAQGSEVKTIYELTLDIKGILFEYNPGDAIGIIPHNDASEVHKIITRLGLDTCADKPYTLSLSDSTTKKKVAIPKHVPHASTIRMTLMEHLDIRSVPKKLFLKSLLDYTTSDEDKEKLQNLTNPKQTELYQEFISNQGKTFLELLHYLPSCNPPIELLFETLPPLQPRYYSVASSPLQKDELVIVFSIINQNGIKGVCTGWLEKCALNSLSSEIEFYFRNSSDFLKTVNPQDGGIIMIGPGTGVAPFIGFLQDVLLRNYIEENVKQLEDLTLDDDQKPKSVREKKKNIGLYFGCRYPDKDYIYKKELLHYLDKNVLGWLNVAFSRQDKVYIQDKLEYDGEKIVDCILNKKTVICVCGDAKNIGKSVEEKIVTLLVKHGGKLIEKANEYMKEMKAENRFQLDIWF